MDSAAEAGGAGGGGGGGGAGGGGSLSSTPAPALEKLTLGPAEVVTTGATLAGADAAPSATVTSEAPEVEQQQPQQYSKRSVASMRRKPLADLSVGAAVESTASGSSVAWQAYLIAAYVVGRWLWRRFQERRHLQRQREQEQEEEERRRQEEGREDDEEEYTRLERRRRAERQDWRR